MLSTEFHRALYRKYALFVASGAGMLLLFFWSFFEAGIWVLAPDFLIMLYCFAPGSRFRRMVPVAVAGSLAGGIVYYTICLIFPEQSKDVLLATPFVTQNKISFISSLYEQYGVLGAFAQSFTLMPFKMWTHTTVMYDLQPVPYFLIVMLSRGMRFLLSGLLAKGILALVGAGRLERHFLWLVLLFTTCFFTFQFIME